MTAPIARADIAALSARLETIADPADAEAHLRLLRLLYEIGRRDLPLGRLFEGHVDALQIVSRFGSDAQREQAHKAVRNGAAFGVWNADQPGNGTEFTVGRLTGAKSFASGAGILSHALISVDADGERQLLLLDLAEVPPQIDRSWWRTTGMQRSETHVMHWHDQPCPVGALIGQPGDYVREPWFSGGAIRFAAVQAGGIAAVVYHARAHLVNNRRQDDPHQRVRLAELYRAAQSAAGAVAQAAQHWSSADIDATLAHVAAARTAVYAAGEAVLTHATAAVGVQAMFADYPLAVALRDLDVYLRQPAPDAQRDRVGAAVAAGLLRPAL